MAGTELHRCTICGGLHATQPRSQKDSRGNRCISSWVHGSCAARRADSSARRAAAKMARQWEKAGQQSMFDKRERG